MIALMLEECARSSYIGTPGTLISRTWTDDESDENVARRFESSLLKEIRNNAGGGVGALFDFPLADNEAGAAPDDPPAGPEYDGIVS